MKKIKKFDFNYEAYLPKTNKQLISYMIKPYRLRFGSFFALTFIGVLGWNASSYVASLLITDLSVKGSVTGSAWRLVVFFGVFRMLDEIFWRIAEILMRTFKPQMIERTRSAVFAKVLQRPHNYFVNSSSGRIAFWINQITNSANRIVDNTIWGAWGEVLGLVLSAIFLAVVHWSLAIIFAVWLILLFWFNIRRGRKFADLIAKQSDEESIASSIVVDVMSNNSNVRAFNSTEYEKNNLYAQQKNVIDWWRKSWRFNLLTNTVKGQSTAIVNILALIFAVVLFSKGIIPIGGLVLFLAYFNAASSGLWNLAWQLDEYYRLFGTVQNALDGLQGEEERRGETVPDNQLPAKVNLELRNLHFHYAELSDVAVLHGLSLEIKQGEKIGLVGHSGAGKSTLVGLLLGFYEPTKGKILINAQDVSVKDPSFVRSISSYVPQDTTLFNRTIRENIVYAKPNATDSEIWNALDKAEASEFVKKLPKGIETLVGERGVKLSGGQRQRIAIARAILKDAPLLILDEATSALDSVSEQAIQKALHELMKGRTAVVIAHRLSTLKHLDKIAVIEKGKVIEQGSHEELLALPNGIYADLWKRQKDGFIVE